VLLAAAAGGGTAEADTVEPMDTEAAAAAEGAMTERETEGEKNAPLTA